MKKTFVLLLLALCGAATLHAQAQRPAASTILELMRKHTAAFGPAFAPEPLQKGTAAGERISAEGDYGDPSGTGNIVLTDSVRFKYSNGRYSKFDYNQFQYISLNLNGSTMPDFLYMEPTPNNFDSSNVPLVSFDSLYHYTLDTNTGNLYLNHREGSTAFNADTSFTQVYNDVFDPSGALQSTYGERVQYNAAGRITRVTATGPGGSTSTIAVRSITYNGAGRVTVDSFIQDYGAGLRLTSLTYYTYDAAGHYVTKFVLSDMGSGSLDTISRATNTYYANGQLRTALYEDIYNTGTLAPSYKDSLAYTPGVFGYTGYSEEVYDPSGAVFYNVTMRTLHTTAGKKDSVIFALSFSGSPMQDFFALSLRLNASGDPVRGTQYDLQSGPPGNVNAYRNWYYEPITTGGPGTGVKPTSAVSITIAPNPTKGVVTLDYADAKAGTPVTVRITNMTGQLVYRQSFVLQGRQQQISFASEAAPGQYMISVQDAAGNLLCSRKIIRE